VFTSKLLVQFKTRKIQPFIETHCNLKRLEAHDRIPKPSEKHINGENQALFVRTLAHYGTPLNSVTLEAIQCQLGFYTFLTELEPDIYSDIRAERVRWLSADACIV